MKLSFLKDIVERCLLWASLLLLSSSTFGQALEANHWYFGYGAGMKFHPDGPKPDTNGVHRSVDAVATISDAKGNLLFYADRENVYNALHDTMKNGKNILNSRNLLILQQPLSPNIFWLFSINRNLTLFGSKCQYYTIDISKDAGLGEVVSSGFLTDTLAHRGMAVCDHSNGVDKWLVFKLNGQETFKSFLITKNGLKSSSSVNSTFSGSFLKSHLFIKSSPNSQFIVAVYRYPRQEVLIYNFNRTTGKLISKIYSEAKQALVNEILYAGFTPNSKIVLVARRHKLLAYDISSKDSATIHSTELLVDSNLRVGDKILDLQIGLDGNIYFLNEMPEYQRSKKISRILCPDNIYSKITVEDTILGPLGFHLGGQLPTLNQTLYVNTHKLQAQSLGDTVLCQGDSTTLTAYGAAADQFVWSPATGLSCTNCQSPRASPSKTTTYRVTGIARSCTQDRTHTAYITVYVNPPKGQGKITGDTVLCPGKQVTLSGPTGFSTYKWSNGFIGRSQTVQTAGNYQLQVVSKCYTDNLTHVLKIEPPLAYRFPNDTLVCADALPIELGGWSNLPFSINFTNQRKFTVTRPTELIYEIRGACSSLDYYVTIDTLVQETRALASELPDTLEQLFTHSFAFSGYLEGSSGVRSYFSVADSIKYSQEEVAWVKIYQIRESEGCSDTLFIKKIEIYTPEAPQPIPKVGDCSIEIAPNPGVTEFRLSTNQALQQVAVYDARSRKMLESFDLEAGEYTVPTIKWSAGTYYIKAKCADDSHLQVRWIKSK